MENLENIIESILFVAGDGVAFSDIAEKLQVEVEEVENAVNSLKEAKEVSSSGIQVIIFNGKAQLCSNPIYANEVSEVLNPIKEKALTKAVLEVAAMISATEMTVPALISFIAFNMTTIPCFATVATTKGELTNKKFKWTLVFWLVTSYVVSMMIYLIGTYWWTAFIFIALAVFVVIGIRYYNLKVRK